MGAKQKPSDPSAAAPQELDYDDRMSDADNLMWVIERNPMLRSTITSIAFLDSAPDREQLYWRIDRASRRIPRLRQRVVANPMSIAPPRWEVDPDFNLAFHLRWSSLGGTGTPRDLLDLAQPIAMQGFDRARPLWEFTLVEGMENGSAAFIIKMHHAITDGVGAIKMALETFSLDDTLLPRDDLPPEPEAHVLSQSERVIDAIAYETRQQIETARSTWSSLRKSNTRPTSLARQAGATAASAGRLLQPAMSPMSPLMTERSLGLHFDVLTVGLDELKTAARKADGKLNDAFLAAICRGISYYHDLHERPVSELRMGMPINNRSNETENQTGNQFTPARFPVPVDIEDPVEHMRALQSLVRKARDEPAQSMVEPMAGVLRRLPKVLTTNLFGVMLTGVDFLTSNVPGVPVPLYLEGTSVTSQYAFGPLSGAAVNCTLLSYVDQVHIGVNIDTAAVPDPVEFLACLQRGFDRVLAP